MWKLKNLFLFGLILVSFVFFIGNVSAIGFYPLVEPSMKLYYHLNNNASIGENTTYVVDSSPTSNNGTARNVSFNTNLGVLGDNTAYFNGSLIPGIINLTTKNVTLNSSCFWSKPTGSGQRDVLIRTPDQEEIGIRSTGYWAVFQNGTWGESKAKAVNDEWQYICISHNGSAYDFYFNGVWNSSINKPVIRASQISSPGSSAYNGSLDEIIIWDRALDAGEIWNNFFNYYGCLTPYDDITLSGNTTFCNGTYQINDTNTNGVIILKANNSYIRGNGTTIRGNNLTQSLGISGRNNFNLLISNINISSYFYAIELEDISGVIIRDNYYDSQGVHIDTGNNIQIINETLDNVQFYPVQQDNFTYFLESVSVVNITNLRLTNGVNRIRIRVGDNVIIKDNYIFNISYYGHVFTTIRNLTITNNTYDLNSYAFVVYNSSDVLIENNTLNNSITNKDNWNIPIIIDGIVNAVPNIRVNIKNNYISNFGVGGILIRASRNVSVDSNFINPISIPDMTSRGIINTAREPICNICLLQLQQTFLGNADNNLIPPPTYLSLIKNYSSQNVTIINNTYGPNTQVYVYEQETRDLNILDLPFNYWHRSYRIPDFLVGRSDLYINSAFSSLSYVNKTSGQSYSFFQAWGINSGLQDEAYFIGKYSIARDYIYFKNLNQSLSNKSPPLYTYYNVTNYTISIFNSSDVLFYNTDGSVICQNIVNCDGSFNMTLPGFNESYALDNFNLTEGISRQFSPLTFTASSSTSKSIQSNLTQTINATTVFDIDTSDATLSCDLIRTLKYTPFGGTQISPSYSCDNNTKQVTTTVTINPTVGNQANQFELTFLDSQIIACDALTSSFANSATLVGLLVAVIFLSVIIALLFTAFTEGLSPATLDSLGRNILMASAIGILIVSFIYIIATTGGC